MNEDSSHRFSVHADTNLAIQNRAAEYFRHWQVFTGVTESRNRTRKGFSFAEIIELPRKWKRPATWLPRTLLSQIPAADCSWTLQVIKITFAGDQDHL